MRYPLKCAEFNVTNVILSLNHLRVSNTIGVCWVTKYVVVRKQRGVFRTGETDRECHVGARKHRLPDIPEPRHTAVHDLRNVSVPHHSVFLVLNVLRDLPDAALNIPYPFTVPHSKYLDMVSKVVFAIPKVHNCA